jgi:hypothetical protein
MERFDKIVPPSGGSPYRFRPRMPSTTTRENFSARARVQCVTFGRASFSATISGQEAASRTQSASGCGRDSTLSS